MAIKELAKALSELNPTQIKELNTLTNGHNLRTLLIMIKPLTGGCTPGSCDTGYRCDPASGKCILNAG